MQTLKCIANLQYTTQLLQKTVRKIKAQNSGKNLKKPLQSLQKDPITVLSSLDTHFCNERDSFLRNETTMRLECFREKLLFKRIPLTLSLLERNMRTLQMVQKHRQAKKEAAFTEMLSLGTPGDAKVGESLLVVSSNSLQPTSLLTDSPVTPSMRNHALKANMSPYGALDDLHDKLPVPRSHANSNTIIANSSCNFALPMKDPAKSDSRHHLGSATESTTLPTMLQARNIHKILRFLHAIESERRRFLGERHSTLTRRIHRLRESLLQEKKRTKHPQAKLMSGKSKKNTGASYSSMESGEENSEALRSALRNTCEELELLNRSLVARPFLSVRLWKVLLEENTWNAVIVHQKKQLCKEVPQKRCHNSSDSTVVLKSCPLLHMLGLFSRIVLGVLHDYVGGSEVNKVAPRFAVSLPSVRWLRKKQQLEQKQTEGQGLEAVKSGVSLAVAKTKSNCSESVKEKKITTTSLSQIKEEEDNDLLLMMCEGADAANAENLLHTREDTWCDSEKKKVVRLRSNHQHPISMLCWMPPRSDKVLPLMIDTLAMFAGALADLNTTAIVRLGGASDVLSLLCVLQHTATAMLLMGGEEGSSMGRELHSTLKNLEQKMLGISNELRDEVLSMLCEGNLTPVHTPEQAARMIVEMQSLRLLPWGDPNTVKLLNVLIGLVFPELRTNTLHVLVEKSRRSNLLAFATRKHRLKLYELYGHAKAESFVLQSIVEQARLQQRKMSAALREAHLNQVRHRSIQQLVHVLSLRELIALLQILARQVTNEPDRGPSLERLEEDSLNKKRSFTAVLFVLESIFLSCALDQTRPPSSGAEAQNLQLEDWGRLWVVLITLLPALERWQGTARQRSHRISTMCCKPERLIMNSVTEMTCHSIIAILAERVNGLLINNKEGRRYPAQHGRGDPNTELAITVAYETNVSAQSLSIIGFGIREWMGNYGRQKKYTVSDQISKQVKTLAKFVREVLLYDISLRQELRRWQLDKREAFHREMTECLRIAELLDDTSELGLRQICFKL